MSKFLDLPLTSEFVLGSDDIIITKDFRYQYKADDIIEVPNLFRCDGASIPKWAWTVIGHPFKEYLEAAVIHDYLYRNSIGTKSHADKVFLQAMKDLKVNIVKRRLMYWAVVVGGRGSWK
jgi:hypothetical protein